MAGVMRAVRRNNATGAFSWIGSDGWSARNLVSDGNEAEVEGTLSVQPQANPVKGFEEYFLNLTAESNNRNPWFIGKYSPYPCVTYVSSVYLSLSRISFFCDHVWGFFGTAACRPIVPLPPVSSPHSSPEAPRTTHPRETSASEGGNYTRNFATTS